MTILLAPQSKPVQAFVAASGDSDSEGGEGATGRVRKRGGFRFQGLGYRFLQLRDV